MLPSVLYNFKLNICVVGPLIGQNKLFDNVILVFMTFYRLNEFPTAGALGNTFNIICRDYDKNKYNAVDVIELED